MRRAATALALVASACSPSPQPAPPPTTTAPEPTTTSPPPAAAPATTSPGASVPSVRAAAPPPREPVPPPVGAGRGATAEVSWYGSESGSRTANGEAFDGRDLTFAHRTMAFGSRVRFCHAGRCVVARCNDRGPFVGGRRFDLSRAAFAAIAPLGAGVITVEWAAA